MDRAPSEVSRGMEVKGVQLYPGPVDWSRRSWKRGLVTDERAPWRGGAVRGPARPPWDGVWSACTRFARTDSGGASAGFGVMAWTMCAAAGRDWCRSWHAHLGTQAGAGGGFDSDFGDTGLSLASLSGERN